MSASLTLLSDGSHSRHHHHKDRRAATALERAAPPETPAAAVAAVSETARAFFDRPPPDDYLAEWARRLAQPEVETAQDLRSVVIFRLQTEYLALGTTHLVEITDPHTVHSIPHRSNQVLLGLVNIRGQLRLYVSLHGLLGVGSTVPGALGTTKAGHHGTFGHTTYSRMVVLQHRGEQWVFLADEVLGVHRFSAGLLRKVPSTYMPANSHTHAVFDWKGHTVGNLDADRLVTSLRSHCQ